MVPMPPSGYWNCITNRERLAPCRSDGQATLLGRLCPAGDAATAAVSRVLRGADGQATFLGTEALRLQELVSEGMWCGSTAIVFESARVC